jgi:hypothetical protein
MKSYRRFAKTFLGAFVLCCWSLSSPARALTLDPFTEAPGIFSLRVSHDPSAEPIAALRLRLYLKSSAHISALDLRPGPSGVWSQLPPELKRDGRIVEVMAVSPNHSALSLDSGLAIFRLDFALAALDTALIDSARVVEAYDYRARPLPLALRTGAFTTGLRGGRVDANPVALRRVDRIYEMAFFLGKAMPVHARVLDTRGKTVRDLQSTPMPAGRHRLRWDGRTAAGRAVSSGEYFLELRLGPNTYHKSVSHIP